MDLAKVNVKVKVIFPWFEGDADPPTQTRHANVDLLGALEGLTKSKGFLKF